MDLMVHLVLAAPPPDGALGRGLDTRFTRWRWRPSVRSAGRIKAAHADATRAALSGWNSVHALHPFCRPLPPGAVG